MSDSEAAVLGSILLNDTAIPRLVVDMKLTPDSFAQPAYGRIWDAMVTMHSRGDGIDHTSLSAFLKRKDDEAAELVGHLAAAPPSAARVMTYAKAVLDAAEWRRVKTAECLLGEASETRDRAKRSEAERLLTSARPGSSDTMGPEALAQEVWKRLDGEGGKTWATPWRVLNEALAGGLRRGQVTVLGGWTSDGKSVLLDQLLLHLSRAGAKVHLYINEMDQGERAQRLVSMMSGVGIAKILQPEKLTAPDRSAVVSVLPDMPFGITQIAAWSAEEVARDIRYRGWDVCGVDLISLLPYKEQSELAEIARTLAAAAKTSGAHLVTVTHLNESRSTGRDIPPVPTMADIRDSGMVKNGADNVMFVYRQRERDDSSGLVQVTDDASLFSTKARGGVRTALRLRFDGPHVRFSEVPA